MNRQCPYALLVASILLTGCVTAPTQPSRIYLLAPLPEVEAASPVRDTGKRSSVRLAEVGLPKYLDRPQIVSRAAGNRLELAEFDRWAEPLEENIARVLAENLSYLLAEQAIMVHRGRLDRRTDYVLRLDIVRMERNPDGKVHLKAHWSVSQPGGGGAALPRTSDIRAPITGSGHSGIVTATSRALGTLSKEIAAGIREIDR